VVWGTQAGHLARTGGDDSGALGGLNVGAGKRKARKSWLSHAREGKRGGSGVGDATRRQGENGARHPGSCAGATETGAGRAVFGVVRKQGVGGARGLHMRAWAGLGEGRSWAGPESNSANFDLK
jgi:hypothetical protein